MAVDVTDLLAPTGDLLPEFFPGETTQTVEARLAGYLADAGDAAAAIEDAAVQDRAVTHFAYARAYGAIYVRLSHAPSTVEVNGEVTASRLVTQIQTFRELRDEHRAQFDALLATATPTSAAAPPVRSDVTVHSVIW